MRVDYITIMKRNESSLYNQYERNESLLYNQ